MKFWARLDHTEATRYMSLLRRIDLWVQYCQSCREAKPPREIDFSLNLPNEDYIEADRLAQKFWGEWRIVPRSDCPQHVNGDWCVSPHCDCGK